MELKENLEKIIEAHKMLTGGKIEGFVHVPIELLERCLDAISDEQSSYVAFSGPSDYATSLNEQAETLLGSKDMSISHGKMGDEGSTVSYEQIPIEPFLAACEMFATATEFFYLLHKTSRGKTGGPPDMMLDALREYEKYVSEETRFHYRSPDMREKIAELRKEAG